MAREMAKNNECKHNLYALKKQNLIIGTRGSALALWQANHIQARLKDELGIESTLQIVKTKGDKILDVPLAKIGGKGLFTKELEELLLKGEIDLAVHSLKDVPVELPKGLMLASITKREDARDCLLSHKYASLDSLPKGAKIGTTSLRRAMQILAKRPDLETLSLRGNLQTRLKKLESGDFHAIMLAAAGLKRLGITNEQVAYITPFEVNEIIPAMGQACLGIECKNDNPNLISALKSLSDDEAQICAGAEREFVRVLDGGCQVPIGVHCEIIKPSTKQNATNAQATIKINAIVGLPNGKKILKESIQKQLITNEICPPKSAQSTESIKTTKSAQSKKEILPNTLPQTLLQKENLQANQNLANAMARELAQKMIAQGAKEILQEALSFWD